MFVTASARSYDRPRPLGLMDIPAYIITSWSMQLIVGDVADLGTRGATGAASGQRRHYLAIFQAC